MLPRSTFNPAERKHWPIVHAFEDGKLSRAQAAAQLRDLGMVAWEIELYLDEPDEAGDAA